MKYLILNLIIIAIIFVVFRLLADIVNKVDIAFLLGWWGALLYQLFGIIIKD